MKSLLLSVGISCGLSAKTAHAREVVPQRWGVYIMDVAQGDVRSMGDFSLWQLSPDGRFLVGGGEKGTKNPFYDVSVVATSGGNARRLERFSIDFPSGARFRWSEDSARVVVEADRNDDGKNEFKTFAIARASTKRPVKRQPRTLSVPAMKRLKARYSKISDIAFSPDGKRVAAYLSRSSYEKPNFDGGLWTFAPNGTGLKRITRNEPLPNDFYDVEPHWLPDGKRLAFRRTSFEDEGT